MKLLLIIILLAIFSTSDAYGFLNKDKGKNVAKSKKPSKLKTSVATELQEDPQNHTNPRTDVKSSLTIKTVPSSDTNKAPSKVGKSTVDKLQIIEQQHYHGNRELLIKHLQRQIELKKQQSTNQESTNNVGETAKQFVQESSPKYNHISTNIDKSQVNSHQEMHQQQNNQVKRSPTSQRRTVKQQNLNSQHAGQVRQLQQSHQSLPQQSNQHTHMQQLPLQSNTVNSHQQQQQLPTQQAMQNFPHPQQQHQQQQQQQQLNMITQQQYNQQLLNQQNLQQSQQSGLFAQQHSNQQQNTMQHIQPQAKSSIRQEVNHIEQSFLPKQDLMHIQNQFKNRNNVQTQIQVQPMDMHEPINLLQNGNPTYQSHQSHAQVLVQQPQLRIQTLHQQPSNRINNHLQLQQHNANQAAMQNQHLLMPINSIPMDSLLSPKSMQPERYILVQNNNQPAAATTTTTTTTQKPTTTTTKPTTTTTTPKPTTTRSTTTKSESEHNVKRETKSPSMKQKFFEKEMRKQDLEITKLELEIRALKRIEKYGTLPKELELEAARRKASATKTTTTTTTTMMPFLDFGKNKLKFPFDF